MRVVILATAAVLAVATAARAESGLVDALTAPAADASGWYLGAGGGVRVQQLPDAALLNDADSGGALATLDTTVVMGGGGVTLGHLFGQQLAPQLWGGRAHLAASAYYYDGSAEDDLLTRAGNGFMIDFNGDPIQLITPARIAVDTDYSDWGLSLRGGLDFDLGGGLLLTPSLALFGGQTRLSQDMTIEEMAGDSLPNYFDSMSQDVDNTRLGAALGLGASYGFAEGWSLRAGAQVGLTYNISQGQATLCNGNESFAAACDGGFVPPRADEVGDTRFGVQVGGGLGLTYDLGFASVALTVEGSYDSYVPSFDWGNRPGDRPGIAADGAFAYGGGISVTVPLN